MDVFSTPSLVCKLYSHYRFTLSTAINQTLPGLEDFLKVVLGSEPLSEEANRQRIEFLRRLESVSRPPSLPPRPANLSEIYRARLQQNEAPSGSGLQDESSVYKNDKTIDPVQFASQQRELSRFATLYKTCAPQTVIIGDKGNRNGGLYFARPGSTRVSEASLNQLIWLSWRFLMYTWRHSLLGCRYLYLSVVRDYIYYSKQYTCPPCREIQYRGMSNFVNVNSRS